MINLILLAAGMSCRFGENKLLYEIEGKSMYRHMFDHALNFQRECELKTIPVRLILVTAYKEIENYARTMAGFCPQSADRKTRVLVHNENPKAGISRSIILGLDQAELSAEEDCVMFTVCDQPWLTREDMELLSEKFMKSGKGIGGLSYEGSMGNPVIFRRKYVKELLTLTGDEGGKKVVRRHLNDCFLCEVSSPKVLQDMDRKEEGINR